MAEESWPPQVANSDAARERRLAEIQEREERKVDREVRDEEEEGSILVERPRVYLIEGLGDDVMNDKDGYLSFVAGLTEMFYVRQIKYEEAMCRFTTIRSIAEYYKGLVMQDMEDTMDEDTNNKVVIIGYAFGAVIAHKMACLFEETGIDVALALLDSEVVWQPPKNYRRLGGYEWLGDEIESALMLCRAVGCRHFVEGSVRRMEKTRKELYDEKALDEFMMASFCQQANNGRITKKGEFLDFISENSRKLKYMHSLTSCSKEDPQVFDGCALHIHAWDSSEYAEAWNLNSKYCSQLQSEEVNGTHYDFLEAGKAFMTVEALRRWLARRGFLGSAAWRVVAKMYGTTVIREGQGAAVYFVYDSSEDCFGAIGLAMKYKSLAKTLAPFRVVVLCNDEEVAAKAVPAGQVYTDRILQDLEGREDMKILIACSGFSGADAGWYVKSRLGLSGYSARIVVMDEDLSKEAVRVPPVIVGNIEH